MKWVRGNTDGFLKMLTKIVSRFKGLVIELWAGNASWHNKTPSEAVSFRVHKLEHSLFSVVSSGARWAGTALADAAL